MAPRGKATGPKFFGELASPIVIPFYPIPLGHETHPDGKTAAISVAEGVPHQIYKMLLLLHHYNIPRDKEMGDRWFLLALQLAIDFVPGLRLVYDDPLAKEAGLPSVGGSNANRAGSGIQPWLSGSRLLFMVKYMKGIGADKGIWQSDAACAEAFYESIWPKSRRPTTRERQSALRTIKRRITAARAKEEGAAKITRSKTTEH